MKNKIRIISIFALLLISYFATAQQASTLYYMDRVFQSQTVNVSEIPSNKIQVGGLVVPVFGQLPPAFYFNYGNNSFHYNHILHFGKDDMKDSLVLDMPLLMKKVRKNVCIRNELRLDYLNFSLKTKSNAVVTVSLADRFMFLAIFSILFCTAIATICLKASRTTFQSCRSMLLLSAN